MEQGPRMTLWHPVVGTVTAVVRDPRALLPDRCRYGARGRGTTLMDGPQAVALSQLSVCLQRGSWPECGCRTGKILLHR